MLISTLLCIVVTTTFAKDIHVSLKGNDSHNGTLKHPVRSIQKAIDILRESKKYPSKGSYIWIHEGVYRLEKPIKIGSDDSGTPEVPVFIKAVDGDKVTITSAQTLNLKWEKYKNNIYKAKVDLKYTIDQLIVNGKMQRMARYPNYKVSDVGKTNGKEKHTEPFNGGASDAWDISKSRNWKNPTGAYMHAMHKAKWGDIHYEVTGKKPNGELEFIGGWQNNRVNTINVVHKSFRMIENIYEELDAPNEWFYDQKDGTIYYIPDPKTSIDDMTVEVVQQTKSLVEITGDFYEKKVNADFHGGNGVVYHAEMRHFKNAVSNIVFDGITFTGTKRTFMENKEPLVRSDWTIYRGGAFYITGAENITVRNCTFMQLGGNAIFVDGYNRRVKISECYFHHNGATDINFVGSPQAVRDPLFSYGQQRIEFDKVDTIPGPKSIDYPADCIVEQCLMTQCGRVEKQTSGVNIAMSSRITIRHNTIYHVPRAAINVCDGCWGGHLIEWNKCFETVLETGDHGAYNSWGRDRFWHSASPNGSYQKLKDGTHRIKAMNDRWHDVSVWDAYQTIVMRNNFWMCDNGWDVDLDDGSTNYEIYNNLCLKGGMKTREGYHRNVYNNIIFNYYTCNVPYPAPTYDQFRSNIIIGKSYVATYPTKWAGRLDKTLFHNPTYKEAVPASSIQEWTCQDEHSLIGNADFVDPLNGDFTVKSDSPAILLGYMNFPMNGFGVTVERLKKLAPEPKIALPSSFFNNVRKADKTLRFNGAQLKNLSTPSEQTAYGSKEISGVIIQKFKKDSKLKKWGFEIDDVILAIDKNKVSNTKKLLKIFNRIDSKKRCIALILRGQEEITVEFLR
ncbi:right-handed parallel beta-helix repeat-containing protein [Halosquirtibacter laminarini]|uniref:Right-handed parallel beta-helix repeat-containing protein n=1 Tax=Halosquirtibacter laminarini TaxID=3374600 RepID=A0AC61NPA4_9BACT|nr:right-handed parallel beta-helix repeat-containing protein [Prolixibacteraceae bacterium]